MRKLKFQLDRGAPEIIYTTLIRPILEYRNEVWDNCTHYNKEEIEKKIKTRLHELPREQQN